MLEQICNHIHNFFAAPDEARRGTFTIAAGMIELPFLREGQYFRITGSVLNDGVHCYPASNLMDETFTGAIYPMRVPPALLSLAEEIAAWQERYGAAAASPYQSESFGGYSYTRAKVTDGASGWQAAFRSQLDAYRKLA